MKNAKSNLWSMTVKKTMVLILALTLILSGIVQFQVENVQAASAETKAKNAYATFLSKRIKWDGSEYRNPSELKFGLIDIDNNKVPELYLYTKKWSYGCPYKLYSYIGGKVKCIYSVNHRDYKMMKVFPAKKTFYVGGDGLKYGSSFRMILEFRNGRVYERGSFLKSGLTGQSQYYNAKGQQISKSAYDKIFRKYISGVSSKNPPTLYNNTASNRDTKLRGKKPTVSPVKFKKTNLWAFSNGGFYLKITSVSGRKMKVSIDSTGKKATAQYTCEYGEKHKLTFWISGNGIKVKETTECTDKLLGWRNEDRYVPSITHGFYPQSHFY